MAQKQFKIGLSNTDKQNMAQDVYERLLALTFPEYETTESYEIGDFVVYNDQLYKCIGATSGAWDSSKWQLATLNDLVTDIENAVAFVNDKANVDGNYPTMTVGFADNLTPYDESAGDDQDEPFSLQATGTGNGTQPDFSTGSGALMKEKQGNTVVVNQLVNEVYMYPSPSTINGITYTKIDNETLTISGTATQRISQIIVTPNRIPVITNHYYLIFGMEKNTQNIGLIFNAFKDNSYVTTYAGKDTGNGIIVLNNNAEVNQLTIELVIDNGTALSKTYTIKPKAIDLTQWFNGDIPQDLLDHPEHFFRYYQGSLAYNEGTLVNANGRYIKCIGMNQWDEERDENKYLVNGVPTYVNGYFVSKNFIRVIPNAEYGITNVSGDGNISLYDANQNYIDKIALSQISPTSNTRRFTVPSNCCYIKFYNPSASSNISINLYYEDEPRCLTYEPYQVLTNNDTGTEVLRSAGNVKDSKAPDGTITRRVVNRSLKDLSWDKNTYEGNVYYRAKPNNDFTSNSNLKGIIAACPTYQVTNNANGLVPNNCISFVNTYSGGGNTVLVRDDSISTVEQLVAKINGELNVNLLEPTTEQGTPYSENLIIDDFGSMDFDSDVPQGALIFYPVDYKAFVDTLYNYTDGTPSNLALNSELNDKFESYLKSLSGYDGTATQVLKNVEGTLTWVTEGE